MPSRTAHSRHLCQHSPTRQREVDIAVYGGTTGIDTLVGRDNVANVFDFASAEWQPGDSVDGGTGTGIVPMALDELWLTDGVWTASDLASITDIEKIRLYGAAHLQLTTALIELDGLCLGNQRSMGGDEELSPHATETGGHLGTVLVIGSAGLIDSSDLVVI